MHALFFLVMVISHFSFSQVTIHCDKSHYVYSKQDGKSSGLFYHGYFETESDCNAATESAIFLTGQTDYLIMCGGNKVEPGPVDLYVFDLDEHNLAKTRLRTSYDDKSSTIDLCYGILKDARVSQDQSSATFCHMLSRGLFYNNWVRSTVSISQDGHENQLKVSTDHFPNYDEYESCISGL